ncbi:phosphoesterase [Thermoclostridium stercorarium]|uniref:PHP domain-containing protein n=1 Tax=Thermoclostridium stercorarium TaxID=1510 RepID=UPI0004AF7BE9|nr:PHP domain-containing protein [Thermoclostridium stercorarium]UZQ86228.1 phosphoesterase [Thermoclostridium stercorarium]
MVKAAVDLHIHSCLSPCASNDMTPGNIVMMSKLKGLDIISVCDHNHTGNLEAVAKVAGEVGILFVPGLELETSEEIHVLCYFPSLESALNMQAALKDFYTDITNREDIFGEQWIMDENDRPVRKVEHLLTAATKLDLYKCVSLVREMGGVPVPAHVDRNSYSIISNLGSVPEDLGFNTLELSRYTTKTDFLDKYPEYSGKFLITSSDAHDLGMILERESFIELERLSVYDVFERLKGCGG